MLFRLLLDRKDPGAIKLQRADSNLLVLLILAILFSVTVPYFLATCMLLLEIDPVSLFMLRNFGSYSRNNLLILAIKCLPFYYISHLGWFGIFSVLLIILIQLHYGCFVINKGLQLVKDLSQNLIQATNCKRKRVDVSYDLYKKQVAVIREVLYTIKLMRLILPLVDEALFIILPFLLLFGEMIFVSCNYATIKMYDSIPMPFFLTVPTLSFLFVVIVQALFPPAASVFENSTKSLLLLKSLKIVGTDKSWIRVIRATRPPRFNFGSMFHAKRSTKTTYFECCFNHTINAIILM